MTFTPDDVFGCDSCLLVANSATATKLQEIQLVSRQDLLTNVLALHIANDHDDRNQLLNTLEGINR